MAIVSFLCPPYIATITGIQFLSAHPQIRRQNYRKPKTVILSKKSVITGKIRYIQVRIEAEDILTYVFSCCGSIATLFVPQFLLLPTKKCLQLQSHHVL